MSRNAILSAGRDRPLLFTRNRVLEEAGYIVTATSTAAETVEKFFAGDFDLDGRYDAATANDDPSANNLSILYNCARDLTANDAPANCDEFGGAGPTGEAPEASAESNGGRNHFGPKIPARSRRKGTGQFFTCSPKKPIISCVA